MYWRRKWQPTPVFLPENPRDKGAWWAAVYGVAHSRTRLKRLSSSSSKAEASTAPPQQFHTCACVLISSSYKGTSHIGVDAAAAAAAKSLQSCLTRCDPINCSTPGLPVHHQLPELAQTHAYRVSDAIQPSHPLLPPSPPALNLFQYQGLFQ